MTGFGRTCAVRMGERSENNPFGEGVNEVLEKCQGVFSGSHGEPAVVVSGREVPVEDVHGLAPSPALGEE